MCIPSGVVPEGTMEGFKNEDFQLSSSEIGLLKVLYYYSDKNLESFVFYNVFKTVSR